MTALAISNAVLWAAVAALAIALYSMARLIREFLTVAGRDGNAAGLALAIGSQAPAFSEPTLSGDRATLRLGGDDSTLLLFTSSGCLVCEHLLGELVKHVSELAALSDTFIVLNNAKAGMSPQWVGFRLAGLPVQVVATSMVHKAYRIPTYPYFVRIDGTGAVVSHQAVAEWSDIKSQLEFGRGEKVSS